MRRQGAFSALVFRVANTRSDNEVRVSMSVFDRLLDYDPKATREPAISTQMALKELKQAVRRDLEWLLNTRRTVINVPETLTEVNRSVAVYGIPDLTAVNIDSKAEQNNLVKAVEEALATFDPRFKNPKVFLEPASKLERELKFRIEAILDIEPAPEPVVFDTVLQTGSFDFAVKERS